MSVPAARADAASEPTVGARIREALVEARAWFTPARVVNAAVPVLLLAMALAPLEHVYLHVGLWVAIAGGLLLGAAVALVGAIRQWPTLTVLALALPVFFTFGALAAPSTAAAGFLPTPTTLRVMGLGFVTVWKQVLTIAPPLGTGGGLLLLPYLLAFVGALVAVTISVRARRYSLSLIVPAVIGVGSILFGTRLAVLPGPIAVAAVLAALVWVAWRAGRLELNRVLAVSVVLGVAAVGGTGASVFLAPSQPRVVLRDLVDPPPDPHDYPSPLAGFRRYVDQLSEETLFTVTSLPAQTTHLRLATMDFYDGHVWNVAGGRGAGGGVFARIGDRIAVDVPADAVTFDVSVEAFSDVWLPTAGGSLDVDFTAADGSDLGEGFYFNTASDTGLVTGRLGAGDEYTVVAQAPPTLDDLSTSSLVIEPITLPETLQVPGIVATEAARLTDGLTADYARVEAIANGLADRGFFSHGLEGEVPSRPGHGAGRLLAMLEGEQLVGDAEQYAAAMALMVRALNYPARVVMGFEVPTDGSGVITGEDVTAWVEVPFESVGWLPFYPTPEEDQVPQSEDPDPQAREQPQVLQPPPPPQEPPDVPPQNSNDAEVQDEPLDEDKSGSRWVLVSAVVGIPLVVLLSPFLVIAALKARRRRVRMRTGAPVERIAGGWEELHDQAVDLGAAPLLGLTRREAAAALDARFEGAGTVPLARAADAGVFAPDAAAEESAQAFWADVLAARGRLHGSVSTRRRIRARFSLRSLRKRTKVRAVPDRKRDRKRDSARKRDRQGERPDERQGEGRRERAARGRAGSSTR